MLKTSKATAPTHITEGSKISLYRKVIKRRASAAAEFIDITATVREFLEETGISEGSVLVFARHTTAGIEINEHEPLLLRDMAYFLDKQAPKSADYKHNDFVIRTANMTADECPNGHAHCQHLMLNSSETIPVAGGQLMLGKWQRIFLIELDRPRDRQVVIQVQGW